MQEKTVKQHGGLATMIGLAALLSAPASRQGTQRTTSLPMFDIGGGYFQPPIRDRLLRVRHRRGSQRR